MPDVRFPTAGPAAIEITGVNTAFIHNERGAVGGGLKPLPRCIADRPGSGSEAHGRPQNRLGSRKLTLWHSYDFGFSNGSSEVLVRREERIWA